MNKKSRNIVKVLIVTVLVLFITFNVNAYSLNHIFDEYYGVSTIASARTPQRSTLGNDDYAPVISKLNQPRQSSGLSPHTGTDFYMKANSNVYPLFGGIVEYVVPDATPNPNQTGRICIKSEIDGMYYYFMYMHIIPNSELMVGDVVTDSAILGKVQVDCSVGITPTHVHITCRKGTANGLITKLFPFYRSASEYNFGTDMDYLCGDHFDGNMFYIYAYTRTDNGYADPQVDDFDCSKVVMYYNLNNSG